MTSTTPQEIDINFNNSSPGHRSSLDGSFIQDDDSRLLMELGSAKPNLEFDADIVANLDFDDFRRADMQTLLLYPNNIEKEEKSIKNDENSLLSPDLRNFLENLHFLSKSAETTANDEQLINDYGNNNMEVNETLTRNCLKSKKLDYVLTFNNTVTESGVQCLTSVSSEQSSEEILNTFYDTESEYDNFEVRKRRDLWPDIVNSLSKCNSLPNFTNCKVRIPRILSQRWNLKSKFPPKLKKHSINRSLNKQMPSILSLRNENNQLPDFQPKSIIVDDYEYSEYYLNGKYVDMNHNEVGYSLNETQSQPAPQAVLAPPLVREVEESPGTFMARLEAKNLASSKSSKNSSTQIPIPTRDICTQTTEAYTKKWSQNINEWAKFDSLDLDFMRLAFNDAPPLFPSVKKFPKNFLGDEEDQSDSTIEEEGMTVINDKNEIFTDNESINKRDSGLGGSCTMNNLRLDKNVDGPAHVEDWDSLAFLLPDEALKTYKFFKTNTNLLENEQKMRDSGNAIKNDGEKAYFKSRGSCRFRKRTLRR
uniref:Uncharacterized protein n=1 Tax=Romanomermis culicivorax TaxID=13658 RepID=A0A915IJ23_ROMCU